VFRSNSHIYAQIISGCGSRVLVSASTVEAGVRTQVPNGGNKTAAALVGKLIAERAKAAGIETVAFDRAGFLYHGRVKTLAEAAREGGLKF
jgi:large subunit ribosomal protein L18